MHERQFAFRRSQKLVGVLRRNALGEGLRVGKADILYCHADQAAGNEQRFLACHQHARHVIQRRLRIGPANRLVQGGNQVVMPLAILVVHRHPALQELPKRGGVQRIVDLRGIQRFCLVEQESAVAIGRCDQGVARFGCQGEGALKLFCAAEQLGQRLGIQAVEDQHLRPAEKGCVQFEGGVLGGRTHQCHHAALHEGQETVLLRAVEAMDLVHEQQRALTRLLRLLGCGESLLQVRNAAEDRAYRLVSHANGIRQQARDACLAGAGRPPQHHAGQFSGGYHPADGTGLARQVLLPDDLCQGARAQAIGQGRVLAHVFGRGLGVIVGKQIGHAGHVARLPLRYRAERKISGLLLLR